MSGRVWCTEVVKRIPELDAEPGDLAVVRPDRLTDQIMVAKYYDLGLCGLLNHHTTRRLYLQEGGYLTLMED